MNFCPKCRKRLVVQDFCVECGADLSEYLRMDNPSTENSFNSFDFSSMEIEAKKQLIERAKFERGCTPTFGTYYINDSRSKDPIEWIVLAREENKALLISKYALDFKPYNISLEEVTWDKCTLRTYLNNEFFYSAFTRDEIMRIETTRLDSTSNPKYNSGKVNPTEDKIFLLSVEEVNKYFKSREEASCKATPYVMSLDTTSFTSDRRNWWLRTPGQDLECASHVYAFGEINDYGINVNANLYCCIRPAMWVSL